MKRQQTDGAQFRIVTGLDLRLMVAPAGVTVKMRGAC